MLQLSEKWAPVLVAQPETGMGYQIAEVLLRDGTRFDRVVIVGGMITDVDGRQVVPFKEDEMRALKDRRATIAGEIATLKRQWELRRAQLIHVDATIHLLDPNVDLDSLPNKRTMKYVRLFRQGEIGCLILGILREAVDLPVSSPAIVNAIMVQREITKAARRTIVARVRSNLGYMDRCGKISRTGKGVGVRWTLAS